MRQLLQIATILLQNAAVITKCVRFFITKFDSLLQKVTVITNSDVYYKLRQHSVGPTALHECYCIICYIQAAIRNTSENLEQYSIQGQIQDL